MDTLTALERVVGDLQWRVKSCSMNVHVANIFDGLYGFDKAKAEQSFKDMRTAYENAVFDVMTIIEEVKMERNSMLEKMEVANA